MAFVYARNTITGKVTKIPEHYLGHPTLGKNLVPANRHDKDYEPEMYAPKDAGEFTESRKSRGRKAADEFKTEEAVVPEITAENPIDEVSDGA